MYLIVNSFSFFIVWKIRSDLVLFTVNNNIQLLLLKLVSIIFKLYFLVNVIILLIFLYLNNTSYWSWILFVIIVLLLIASKAAFLYDLINPGIPNLVPPKYLTVMIIILVNLYFSIWLNIGFPAVDLGSPSSWTRQDDLS